MPKKTNDKVSKSVKAWGIIPRDYNPERKITSIQFNKPRNSMTYFHNEVVPVLITELTNHKE